MCFMVSDSSVGTGRIQDADQQVKKGARRASRGTDELPELLRG